MIIRTRATAPDGRIVVTMVDLVHALADQAAGRHPLGDVLAGTGHEVRNPAANLVRDIVAMTAETLGAK